MTARLLRNAALGSAIALMTMPAAPAMAQQRPVTVQPGGPMIPGLCIYSSGRGIGASKLGAYVLQRLETLGGQANAEINGMRDQLQADDQALSARVQANPPTIQQAQAEQSALALRQRAQNLSNLIQVRQREIDLTQQKAFERISNETLPLIEQVIQTRGCSVVLEQQATIYAAQAMDITSDVVARLDAKIVEFAFDREQLDQQPAAGVQTPTAGRAGPQAPARGATAPARGATPAPAPGRGGR